MDEIFADSKFLEAESLTCLTSALAWAAGPGGAAGAAEKMAQTIGGASFEGTTTTAAGGDPDAMPLDAMDEGTALFCLDALVGVTLRNRDRARLTLPRCYAFLRAVVRGAKTPGPLAERAIFELLRIARKLLPYKEDLTDELLDALRLNFALEPAVADACIERIAAAPAFADVAGAVVSAKGWDTVYAPMASARHPDAAKHGFDAVRGIVRVPEVDPKETRSARPENDEDHASGPLARTRVRPWNARPALEALGAFADSRQGGDERSIHAVGLIADVAHALCEMCDGAADDGAIAVRHAALYAPPGSPATNSPAEALAHLRAETLEGAWADCVPAQAHRDVRRATRFATTRSSRYARRPRRGRPGGAAALDAADGRRPPSDAGDLGEVRGGGGRAGSAARVRAHRSWPCRASRRRSHAPPRDAGEREQRGFAAAWGRRRPHALGRRCRAGGGAAGGGARAAKNMLLVAAARVLAPGAGGALGDDLETSRRDRPGAHARHRRRELTETETETRGGRARGETTRGGAAPRARDCENNFRALGRKHQQQSSLTARFERRERPTRRPNHARVSPPAGDSKLGVPANTRTGPADDEAFARVVRAGSSRRATRSPPSQCPPPSAPSPRRASPRAPPGPSPLVRPSAVRDARIASTPRAFWRARVILFERTTTPTPIARLSPATPESLTEPLVLLPPAPQAPPSVPRRSSGVRPRGRPPRRSPRRPRRGRPRRPRRPGDPPPDASVAAPGWLARRRPRRGGGQRRPRGRVRHHAPGRLLRSLLRRRPRRVRIPPHHGRDELRVLAGELPLRHRRQTAPPRSRPRSRKSRRSEGEGTRRSRASPSDRRRPIKATSGRLNE